MSRCDLYDKWDDMSSEERLDALKELIQDVTESWGYAPPDVVDGEYEDPGMDGEWDYDNETIILGIDNFDSPEHAIETAFHELGHLMEDYDGFGDPESEGSLAAPWEEETEYPTHEDVSEFGKANAEAHKDECGGRNPFDSPVPPPPPPPSAPNGGGGQRELYDSSAPPSHNLAAYEPDSWTVPLA